MNFHIYFIYVPRTACSFQMLLFSARQGIHGLPILILLLSAADPVDYSSFKYPLWLKRFNFLPHDFFLRLPTLGLGI